MPQTLITERYAADIAGVLNCYDRVVISGQLAPICYAKGMTKYLYVQGMLIFDYTKFANRCGMRFGRMLPQSLLLQGSRSSSSRSKRAFARKIAFEPLCKHGVLTQDWCTFFRQWKRARHTNPGTTKALEKRISE
jgi:hypothetical protein